MGYLLPPSPATPKAVGAKGFANHVSGALSALVGYLYKMRLTSAVTMTLQGNPVDGDTVDVLDCLGNFSTCPVTVLAGAGENIQDGGALLDTDNMSVQFIYDLAGDKWHLRRLM